MPKPLHQSERGSVINYDVQNNDIQREFELSESYKDKEFVFGHTDSN